MYAVRSHKMREYLSLRIFMVLEPNIEIELSENFKMNKICKENNFYTISWTGRFLSKI